MNSNGWHIRNVVMLSTPAFFNDTTVSQYYQYTAH